MQHECRKREPGNTCLCSSAYFAPHDLCPFHGHGMEWQPRCVICGRFMKWSESKPESKPELNPEEE